MNDIIPITELAGRINDEYLASMQSATDAVQHALTAGALLIEAKKIIPHGEWEPFIEDNFEFTPRAALNYIKLAKSESVIKLNQNGRSDLTKLTIAGAFRLIAEEDPTPRQTRKPTTYHNAPIETEAIPLSPPPSVMAQPNMPIVERDEAEPARASLNRPGAPVFDDRPADSPDPEPETGPDPAPAAWSMSNYKAMIRHAVFTGYESAPDHQKLAIKRELPNFIKDLVGLML